MANRYWVGGSGTWNTTSTTNWSASSGGSSGASVPTAADSVFFDQATTYTVTMTGALLCLDLTVSAGTVTFATGSAPTLAVSGNWSITASTVWSSTGTITFNATTSKTITTNGVTINGDVTFSGVGGTKTLQDNLTLGTIRLCTLTSGTLALGSYTLTTGRFDSNNTNTRTLNFDTGKIVLTRAVTSTVWNTGTITRFTVSGTPLVECQGGGSAVTKTIDAGALSEANAISFSLLDTGGNTFTFTANSSVKNLIVDTNGTFTNVALTIYGSFTNTTTNGTTNFGGASNNAWTFAATSGSWSVATISSVNYLFPWTFGSGSSSASATWTLTTGNLKSASSVAQGTITLNSGTLSLGAYTLGCAFFSSNNSNTRTLDFGTGRIQLYYFNVSTSATIWNTATVTNFTISGTPLVECSGGGGTTTPITKTINTGAFSESNAISFSFLESIVSAAVTYAFTAGNVVKNLTINGIQTVSNIAITIYGGFTHQTTNGTTSFTSGANAWTFGATSGTNTITPIASYTYAFPWTFNGVGGTWSLAANLVLGSTQTFTLTNGTFDLNNKTVSGPTSGITVLTGSATLTSTGGTPSLTVPFTHTSGTLALGSAITTSGTYTHTAGTLNLNGQTLTLSTGYTTATGTKNLTFNGGTLVCSAASATAFNNAAPTGFTTTAGTGTGKISMTAATAKTFVGGGSTFNCTLSNDGAGALTITGSNTITTIANGVQPTTISFIAGTTTTVTNWSVNGTPGNLVTIGSTTAAAHTLSKTSGTVSSNFLSISYSTAAGGATWYAGPSSTNGGNNSGWIFTAPPGSTPSFFVMFN